MVFAAAGLALTGCGGGGPAPVITSAPAGSTPGAPVGTTINAIERDYEIELDAAAVSGPFTVAISNEGPGPHGFAIEDANKQLIATTGEISRAKTGQLVVPALAAGEYTYFCPIVGHRREGMEGKLTVQ